MIYTKEAVFIHVPKTAGMSVTRYLVNALDCPMIMAVPQNAKAHGLEMAKTPEAAEKIGFEEGIRHETCEQAVALIRKNGWAMPDFAFAMVRDPVDLLLSYYKHMRKPHVWQREGMTLESLTGPHRAAMRQTFDEFVRRRLYYDRTEDDIMGYYRSSGFARLDVVPFENAAEYLQQRFGHHKAAATQEFEHHNRSAEPLSVEQVSPDTVRHIYEKYPALTETYRKAVAERAWALA